MLSLTVRLNIAFPISSYLRTMRTGDFFNKTASGGRKWCERSQEVEVEFAWGSGGIMQVTTAAAAAEHTKIPP